MMPINALEWGEGLRWELQINRQWWLISRTVKALLTSTNLNTERLR